MKQTNPKKCKIAFFLLALANMFFFTSTIAAKAPDMKHLFADLNREIPKAMAEWKIPGLAIAIVKDDRVVYAKGFGVREVGKPERVDENTIFGCGSTTKAFTAALIGMLVDDGKLSWDDKVIDHLPDFRMFDPWVTREMTIRDLLCHRSGLPEVDLPFFGSFTRDELIQRIRFIEPASSFRSKFCYQNLMLLTAGQLAAKVAGKSWDDLIQERIFTPLGMTRSSTSIRHLSADGNVATPHRQGEGAIMTIPWCPLDLVGPAGSINSTVRDYAQWMRLHLSKGKHSGKKIWNEAIQNEMWSPQTVDFGQVSGPTHFSIYGLGWFLRDYRGRFVAIHDGATDGMGAMVEFLPEESLGVTILCNVLEPPLLNLLRKRIADIALGIPEAEWTSLALPLPPTGTPPASTPELLEGQRPSLPIDRYAGVYENPLHDSVRVMLGEGSLRLEFARYPAARLEHRRHDIFQAVFSPDNSEIFQMLVGAGLDVTFTLDTKGQVTAMNISQFGTFKRIVDTENKGE